MRISIVLPSYNQARWLAGCLESLVSQRYSDLELIVIDGGSTDSSQEIIRSFEREIAYWQSEPDGGQYSAIEAGLDKATGEVVGWLNADDLYLPWTLKTVGSIFSELSEVEWLTSTRPSMVSGDGLMYAAGPSRAVSKAGYLDGLYIPGDPHKLGVIVQEGTFWRKSLWDRTVPRFTDDAPLAGDFELWGRFFKTATLYNFAYPLATMTRHADQRSNDQKSYHAEAVKVLHIIREELGLPRLDSKKAQRAQSFYGNPILKPIARRLFKYSANFVSPSMEDDGSFKSWKPSTIPIW